MLTLGLAVLLPAAALIFVNFLQLRSFDRDKLLEAAIHRDFQEVLAITEKNMNKKAYAMVEEAREMFPSPDSDASEKEEKLDLVLARSPWLTHALLFDEKGYLLRSQPGQMQDKYVRDEHERLAESFRGWFNLDGNHWWERSTNGLIRSTFITVKQSEQMAQPSWRLRCSCYLNSQATES